MMTDPDHLAPYRDAVAEYGPGFRATLWGSREAQICRFNVMIDLTAFDGCVVLDAGCGQGDFAAHLAESGVGYTKIIGVDAMPEMVDLARTRGIPRTEWHAADLMNDADILATGSPDYVCISGTMNTMDDPTAKRLVSRALESAAQGVIFNFLSDRPDPRWHGRDLTPARRFNTVEWLNWSLSLSPNVSFTQDYLDGHDATILIRHST